MKVSPAIAIARKIAGYRPPAEDTVCCRNCRLRYYRAAKRAKLAGLPPESKHR